MVELPEALTGKPLVAFCGIARPRQFFSGLTQMGLPIAATRAFPDHHSFTRRDVEMLLRTAKSAGSGALITTAKDRLRLGDLGAEIEKALPIFTVDLRVVLEDQAGISVWLTRVLESAAN